MNVRRGKWIYLVRLWVFSLETGKKHMLKTLLVEQNGGRAPERTSNIVPGARTEPIQKRKVRRKEEKTDPF